MRIIGTNMSMIRGDSESITVRCKDSDGAHIPLSQGDKLYFTVKKSLNCIRIEIQKIVTEFDNGKAIIGIDPADTKELAYGKYIYDIQLTKSSGAITTIVPPSWFVIEGEVTYD